MTPNDRWVLNGILYVVRTGIPWNDLPQRYGDDSTCHRRFMVCLNRILRWVLAKLFEKLLKISMQWTKERVRLHVAH